MKGERFLHPLKICFYSKRNTFRRYLDGFGMEIQSVCFSPVKRIAEDGHVQALGMRTMNAQLMGAPGLRVESHKAMPRHLP